MIDRTPEPEVMNDAVEARAYRDADFSAVNRLVALRALRAAGKGAAKAAGNALDLGTGPAEIPVIFCRRAPRWRVLAVDASREMLTLARTNVRRHGLQSRVKLLRGDAKALRGVRRRFDLIFSNSLLHHLENPLPFWKEVARLGRGGSAVMVQDLARPRSRARAKELVRRHARGASPILQRLFYQSLLAAFTPREVREQLRKAGIVRLEVERVSDRHLVVRGRL
jgi:ubiquinone/menaquinone biosynthesis C-methylase UbiE